MITIVSSDPRERRALSSLCHASRWEADLCASLRDFRRSLAHTRPKIVLTRHNLGDGYSDDVLATLASGNGPAVSTIVFLAAGTAPALEARQLALGADCVLRDPVRPEVLLAYLNKYRARASPRPRNDARTRAARPRLAGARLDPLDRRLQNGPRVAVLTPREVALALALIGSRGEVLTYERLYDQVLGRPFRGDTSNMRVLLGKLSASTASIGIALRDWVRVIPKAGYCYRRSTSSASRARVDATSA